MQIQGEVSLDLVNARAKLCGPRNLTVLPDPSSIRVKGRELKCGYKYFDPSIDM
jgi:hypothetical protein